MLTAVIIVVIVLAIVCFKYLNWSYDYWQKRKITGPKPQFNKGTFPKTMAGKCNLVEELHEIYLKYKTTQNAVGVFSARSPKLFILDPKLAAEILTQNFSSFHDNESSNWTSTKVEQLRLCSPFVSKGDDWKEKRSELVPALTTNRLRAFYPVLQESAAKLIRFLEKQENMDNIDAKEFSNRFTADIMAVFIWSLAVDAFPKNDTLSRVHEMANAIIEQALKCVRYYGRTCAWPWLRKFRPVRFFPRIAESFFIYLARQSMDLHRQNANDSCDVINHLIQLQTKKDLSDVQIAGHTTTVLIDGFETGAILIAHCLLLLSRNPRVQNKLRAELSEAEDIVTNLEKLLELPYLEQCIQETLRIFPPLPTLFKLCTKPTTLSISDSTTVDLVPNDVVYISSYSFHRDPDYFEHPEQFWPERFDAELGGVRKFRDMGVFLPFGDGPRMCLGMKLGLLETKVAVAKIVRHFELSCSPCTRQDNKIAAGSFLLTLDGGIKLNLKKIQ